MPSLARVFLTRVITCISEAVLACNKKWSKKTSRIVLVWNLIFMFV